MNDGNERVVPPDLVYITFIRTTPQKLWDALTNSALTTKFFFGRSVESDWAQGAPWRMLTPEGLLDVEGVVLESDPPRRLKLTWRVDWTGEAPPEPEPAIITYDIEANGDVVKLTMTQHTESAIPRKYVKAGEQGWAAILSSLKSLLETGEPLVIKMGPPQ